MERGKGVEAWGFGADLFFGSVRKSLDLKSAAPKHRLKACLIDGLDVGIFWLDGAIFNEFKERVVEHDHAMIFAGLHGGRNLERLAFANQVADCRRDDKDFESSDAAAAFLWQQSLRDHAL